MHAMLEDPADTAPMKIIDAKMMAMRKIGPNTPPYQRSVYEANNALVETWYQKVLIPLADSNLSIPAKRITPCLNIFIEGVEIKKRIEFYGQEHFFRSSEANVQFWIECFEKSTVAELYVNGRTVVSNGWNVIHTAIRDVFAAEKYAAIYSKSDDPLVWDRLANENPKITYSKLFPFGLTEERIKAMSDKVMIITSRDSSIGFDQDQR